MRRFAARSAASAAARRLPRPALSPRPRFRPSRANAPAVRAISLQSPALASASAAGPSRAAPVVKRPIRTLLVANRGEIACRVIRTARKLNVRTIAVFSEADANSMHVKLADEAYCVGPPSSTDSYLRADRLLEICRLTGADAIHPGYGFLSENAGFSRKCAEAGIEFVGPPASAIDAMGSKSASKDIMSAAGVALVPGYHDQSDQSPARLRAEADAMGYPVLIKAVLGGGGKGMRIVDSAKDFDEGLNSAIAEARNAFGDDKVLIEKYIQRPRHVEVQVFGDKYGNVVYLFERDCSVQRRHQKVIEEAPAPNLKPGLREKLGQMACDAARAVGYVGAGTVEFIMDVDTQEFWFMEMNTRLQVEHPITEMVTGTDLVEWQLRVAAGEPLPLTQEQLNARLRGWAFEARVYAENPRNNFLPGTGHIVHMSTPEVTFNAGDLAGTATLPDETKLAPAGVRVDTGVRTGDDVSVYYDPMIAKLVVWDVDRASALRRLRSALEQWHVVGLPTNVEFLHALASHPAFEAGDVETGFIEAHRKKLLPERSEDTRDFETLAAVATMLLREEHVRTQDTRSGEPSTWADPWSVGAGSTRAFRMNVPLRHNLVLLQNEDEIQVGVEYSSSGFDLTLADGSRVSVRNPTLGAEDGTELQMYIRSGDDADSATPLGRRLSGRVVSHDDCVHIFLGQAVMRYDLPVLRFGTSSAFGAGSLLSPMPGKITSIMVKVGDRVEAGQPLIKMEAMKMEHTIRAPTAGIVEELRYSEGEIVEEKKQLASIKPDDE